MTLFGVDVHPEFQRGLNIELVAGEGFDLLSVKVSEGTGSSFMAQGSADWLKRGKAAGMFCVGYHYLQPGNEDAQAAVFAAQLAAAGVPGVLDAEAIDANRIPTLRIANVRTFLDRCRVHGADVRLMYLPRWYWSSPQFGSPDMTGLPPLWASSYPSLLSAPAGTLYASVSDNYWNGYGGLPVEILQFGETGQVAGKVVDVNAYRGTRAQLSELLHSPAGHHRHKEHEMTQLPPTPAPTNADSDPKSWPQRNYDVGFDDAGGWEGRLAIKFGVQEWGGRTVDNARGYLSLASWVTPGGLVPVAPVFTAQGGGAVIHDHSPTVSLEAPTGATALTVNYSAPGGAYVTEGRG